MRRSKRGRGTLGREMVKSKIEHTKHTTIIKRKCEHVFVPDLMVKGKVIYKCCRCGKVMNEKEEVADGFYL